MMKELSIIINTELNESQVSTCFDKWLLKSYFKVSEQASDGTNINLKDKNLFISFVTRILSIHNRDKKQIDNLTSRLNKLNAGGKTKTRKRTKRPKHKKQYTRRNKSFKHNR